MVKVATQETNPDGGGMLEDGLYHATIEQLENKDNDKGPQLLIEYQVHAGTTAGQEGKKINDYYPLSGGGAGKILQLACAAGLITKEQWRAAREGGADVEFDENDLVGRQVCIGVKKKPYSGKKPEHQGKSFPDVGFSIWGVFDEQSKEIPKDATLMKMLTPPASNGNSASSPAKPAQQPTRQTTTAKPAPQQQPAGAGAGGSDPWGGF